MGMRLLQSHSRNGLCWEGNLQPPVQWESRGALEQNGEVNVEDDGIISPSRFSVLATKGFEVNDENDDDEKGEDSAEGEEIEEGEVIAEP